MAGRLVVQICNTRNFAKGAACFSAAYRKLSASRRLKEQGLAKAGPRKGLLSSINQRLRERRLAKGNPRHQAVSRKVLKGDARAKKKDRAVKAVNPKRSAPGEPRKGKL